MKSNEAIVVHRTSMLSVIANWLQYVIRYCRPIYSTLSVIANCLQEQNFDFQSNRTRNLGTQLLLSGEKEQSEIWDLVSVRLRNHHFGCASACAPNFFRGKYWEHTVKRPGKWKVLPISPQKSLQKYRLWGCTWSQSSSKQRHRYHYIIYICGLESLYLGNQVTISWS